MMYETPVTRKEHLASLALVQSLHRTLKKMHSLQTFNVENLRKKMRPFFKTYSLGSNLGLTLKYSKLSVKAFFIEEKNGLYCFRVQSTKFGQRFEFTIWAKNDKEFLKKLILDYNLFNIN